MGKNKTHTGIKHTVTAKSIPIHQQQIIYTVTAKSKPITSYTVTAKSKPHHRLQNKVTAKSTPIYIYTTKVTAKSKPKLVQTALSQPCTRNNILLGVTEVKVSGRPSTEKGATILLCPRSSVIIDHLLLKRQVKRTLNNPSPSYLHLFGFIFFGLRKRGVTESRLFLLPTIYIYKGPFRRLPEGVTPVVLA